jgi:hypothetical protein
MDIQADIQVLIGKYGIVALRNQIEKMCRDTFEELKALYEGYSEAESEADIKVVDVVAPKIIKKIIRKPKPVTDFIMDDVCEAVGEIVSDVMKSESICEDKCEADSEAVPETATVNDEPKKYIKKTDEELKQIKSNHRIAVQKKHQELMEKGIDPQTLLNKENLEKWLKMGLSDQKIARDHVGIHENVISSVARAMGLKSVMSGLFPAKRF